MQQFSRHPIFIMGNQRSGTRMVAAILNQHPDIVITDEGHILPRLFEVIHQADRQPRHDDWSASRRTMVETALIETSADYVRRKASSAQQVGHTIRLPQRFGNKTPGLEFMLGDVRDVFPDALFIYCMRHPLKVLSSLQRMPWNRRTVAENWKRYKQSVDLYEAMASEAMLVQIDQVETVEDQRQLIVDLLNHVDTPLESEMTYYATEEPWTPANTLPGGTLKGLTDRERNSITRDPWYRSFCAGYGYTP